MADTVEATVTMRLIGHPAEPGTPVAATFRYDLTRPFSVDTAFHLSDIDVVWTFARDLLLQGIDEPAGQGDVRVWPVVATTEHAAPRIRIELTSPTGHALLEAHTADIRAFLDATLRACPTGEESLHVDVDSWLDELLRT